MFTSFQSSFCTFRKCNIVNLLKSVLRFALRGRSGLNSLVIYPTGIKMF